jgi:hypothetical protein
MGAARKHDDLARAIDLLAEVTRIVNGLRADEPAPFYSQENPPPGMKPRTYLEHCYRGTWENRREGRLRVTDVAAYNVWNETRRKVARAPTLAVVEEIADEVEYIKSGGRRGR